jgi:hypothetical protein
MRNMSPLGGFPAFLTALLLVAITSVAMAQDRFAIAIGAHDTLVVFGPKGDRAAQLPNPTIAQSVTAGGASFQISYGQDGQGRLTAIMSPSASDPVDLHFLVLGKSVDADKTAAVTLIFSANLKSVTIDPGYVGTVEVNSHRLPHHRLGESSSSMRPLASL